MTHFRFLRPRLLGRRPQAAAASRPPATGGRRPASIVLTIDPALFPGTTALALRGWAPQTGEVRNVAYGAIPLPVFAAAGVQNLDAALRLAVNNTDGLVWIIGWSEGAQIAYKWLREYGPFSLVPADRVRFLCIGNPERKYGGACVVPSPPRKLFGLIKPKAAYGGCGIPADTRYTVWDFCRQYDGWADCATVDAPTPDAMAAPTDDLHMDYFSVGLDDPGVLSHTEGNVTYMLHPTPLRRGEECFERPFRCPARS